MVRSLILEWEQRAFRHHGIQSPCFIFIFKIQCSWLSRGDLTKGFSESMGGVAEGPVSTPCSVYHPALSIAPDTSLLLSRDLATSSTSSPLHPSPTPSPSFAQQPCSGPAAPNVPSRLQALSKPEARSSSRAGLSSGHSWHSA